MTRREQQAFNDGKVAFSNGLFRGQCKRTNRAQRDAWKAGWDEGQKLAVSARATPDQAEESRMVLAKLKEWAKTL